MCVISFKIAVHYITKLRNGNRSNETTLRYCQAGVYVHGACGPTAAALLARPALAFVSLTAKLHCLPLFKAKSKSKLTFNSH